MNRKQYIVLIAPMEESILGKIFKISEEFGCEVRGLSTDLIEDEQGKKIECYFQAAFGGHEPRVYDYISKLEKETNALSVQILGNKQK